MELFIKILFMLSLFMFNVSILRPLMKVKCEETQRIVFMVLCGFNVLAVSAIMSILHPLMLDNMPALTFSSFVGGAVIFAVSTLPFHKN